jgi:hypothetical protein
MKVRLRMAIRAPASGIISAGARDSKLLERLRSLSGPTEGRDMTTIGNIKVMGGDGAELGGETTLANDRGEFTLSSAERADVLADVKALLPPTAGLEASTPTL